MAVTQLVSNMESWLIHQNYLEKFSVLTFNVEKSPV